MVNEAVTTSGGQGPGPEGLCGFSLALLGHQRDPPGLASTLRCAIAVFRGFNPCLVSGKQEDSGGNVHRGAAHFPDSATPSGLLCGEHLFSVGKKLIIKMVKIRSITSNKNVQQQME